MEKTKLAVERCKSCGLCVEVCPKGALALGKEINRGGYRYVAVNEDLCIACGSCYIMCPDCVFEINRQ